MYSLQYPFAVEESRVLDRAQSRVALLCFVQAFQSSCIVLASAVTVHLTPSVSLCPLYLRNCFVSGWVHFDVPGTKRKKQTMGRQKNVKTTRHHEKVDSHQDDVQTFVWRMEVFLAHVEQRERIKD